MVFSHLIFILSALLIIATSSSASELVERDWQRTATPDKTWTGFYAGLSAGYSFGTNSFARSYSTDPPISLASVDSAFYPITLNSGVGLAQSGNVNYTQSGFIGGLQLGINQQINSLVFGFEADIQGATISGFGSEIGAAAGYANDSGMGYIYVPEQVWTPDGPVTKFVLVPRQTTPHTHISVSSGNETINASVDWMGTARLRFGYLLTPSLLVFSTGGFTYGGVQGVANKYSINNLSAFSSVETFPSNTRSFFGGGQASQVRVGWNIGAGFEWMLSSKWSLMTEALYWNLGSINFQTYSVSTPSSTNNDAPCPSYQCNPQATVGKTRLNYQGVITRIGLNYHFGFDW